MKMRRGGIRRAISDLAVIAATERNVTLAFTPISGVVGYECRVREVGAVVWPNPTGLTGETVTSLSPATIYEFQVRGIALGGAPLEWSNTVQGTTSASLARIVLSASTMAEDNLINALVGGLSVVGGTGSYTFGIGSNPDGKFHIEDGDELRLLATLNFESQSSHIVTIVADNGVDDPIEQEFTITVTNAADSAAEPGVVLLSPANNEFGVGLYSILSIEFTMPIVFGATVLVRLYKTTGDVLVEEWTEALTSAGFPSDLLGTMAGGDRLDLLVAPLEAATAYYVTVAAGSVKSADGVAFAGIATTWNFSTAAGVANAFAVSDWTIEADDEEIEVTINRLPTNGGNAITGIEYRLDGGSWISTGGLVSFNITSGLTNDVEVDLQLRAVNSAGGGAVSDIKAVTPTAAPFLTARNMIVHLVAGAGTWQDTDGQVTAATSNADPVGHWADQSGNGNHFTDAGFTAKRPVLQNSVVNGQPVIRFNGSSNVLRGPASFVSLTGAEAFIVVKIDTDPPGASAQTGMWDFGAAGEPSLYPWTSGVIYDNFGSTIGKLTVNPTPSLAAFRLYNVISIAGEWTSFLDGTQLYTTASNVKWFTSTPRLGSTQNEANFLDGDIAEFVMYSAPVGAEDKAEAKAYFANKYGLTIA